ncbi:hypothetical protein A2Z33_07245 [Candidatus Gottesmanbacteria bacterium RBG_16_52_11]|uniref:Uncharacterized protein n=1 Tax=Candidatus Gottesmanbacteria bacterium RBG_16_52_11 TaxID=1798374 RepID=A0A1F5YXX9_9BACT|nr:MAG: hypothetical protein A2Z33_07245 [Candidatus Gottesmanbacteria bacterium RBG_16_52_11]
MTGTDKNRRLVTIGQIRDLVPKMARYTDPFLYYLPDILNRPEFLDVNAEKVLEFVRQALNYKKQPMVSDALTILNRMVDKEDGSLKMPAEDLFYGNYSFKYKELGSHKTPSAMILHILNRTLFVTSVGS